MNRPRRTARLWTTSGARLSYTISKLVEKLMRLGLSRREANAVVARRLKDMGLR